MATGASQFEMLEALVTEPDVDSLVVSGFHLDEYEGIPITHPVSFRKYLWERFVSKLPLKAFHYLGAEGDPEAECARVGVLITRESVDVAFIGIGENGHVAFNDSRASPQSPKCESRSISCRHVMAISQSVWPKRSIVSRRRPMRKGRRLGTPSQPAKCVCLREPNSSWQFGGRS